MGFSTVQDNKFLDELFGGVNFVPPATVYIGLSTSTPAKAGTGVTEPSGNAYARVAVTNNTTNFPNAAGGSKSNGTAITFAEATGAWGGGNITHFVAYDAITGGTFLGFGSITTPKTIVSGDTANFPVGTLTFTMT